MDKIADYAERVYAFAVGHTFSQDEADELSQLPGLDGSHDLLADTLKTDAVGRPTGLGIGVQILEILWHGEVEQGHPIVKHRRRAGDLHGVVVPQDAEVAEMSVLIIDHRIKHQHFVQCVDKLDSHLLVICPDQPPICPEP